MTQKTEIATIRQRLIEAQENTTVVFFEAQSELKLLYTQGSKYQNNGILTDEDSKDVAVIVGKINQKQDELEAQRKTITIIIDDYKKDWIEKQRAITAETTELKKDLMQKNNAYLTEKEKKAQAERDRIQKEKDRAIDLAILPDKIANCYKTALTDELSDIRSKIVKAWASLTLETFDDRVKILKSFMPIVAQDKALSYFKIEMKHLSPDEIEGAIRIGFNYELFCQEFKEKFSEIKKTYIDQIDSKKEELKKSSEKQRLEKESETLKSLKETEANEAVDKYKREQALVTKTANVTIQQELISQGKSNTIKSVNGRTNWEAYIEGKVDWQRVMELYVESGGSLDFILNFLKKDRPEIKGIKYKSSKSVINRAK